MSMTITDLAEVTIGDSSKMVLYHKFGIAKGVYVIELRTDFGSQRTVEQEFDDRLIEYGDVLSEFFKHVGDTFDAGF